MKTTKDWGFNWSIALPRPCSLTFMTCLCQVQTPLAWAQPWSLLSKIKPLPVRLLCLKGPSLEHITTTNRSSWRPWRPSNPSSMNITWLCQPRTPTTASSASPPMKLSALLRLCWALLSININNNNNNKFNSRQHLYSTWRKILKTKHMVRLGEFS